MAEFMANSLPVRLKLFYFITDVKTRGHNNLKMG